MRDKNLLYMYIYIYKFLPATAKRVRPSSAVINPNGNVSPVDDSETTICSVNILLLINGQVIK